MNSLVESSWAAARQVGRSRQPGHLTARRSPGHALELSPTTVGFARDLRNVVVSPDSRCALCLRDHLSTAVVDHYFSALNDSEHEITFTVLAHPPRTTLYIGIVGRRTALHSEQVLGQRGFPNTLSYTSNGEVLLGGEVIESGLPTYTQGTRVTVRVHAGKLSFLRDGALMARKGGLTLVGEFRFAASLVSAGQCVVIESAQSVTGKPAMLLRSIPSLSLRRFLMSFVASSTSQLRPSGKYVRALQRRAEAGTKGAPLSANVSAVAVPPIQVDSAACFGDKKSELPSSENEQKPEIVDWQDLQDGFIPGDTTFCNLTPFDLYACEWQERIAHMTASAAQQHARRFRPNVRSIAVSPQFGHTVAVSEKEFAAVAVAESAIRVGCPARVRFLFLRTRDRTLHLGVVPAGMHHSASAMPLLDGAIGFLSSGASFVGSSADDSGKQSASRAEPPAAAAPIAPRTEPGTPVNESPKRNADTPSATPVVPASPPGHPKVGVTESAIHVHESSTIPGIDDGSVIDIAVSSKGRVSVLVDGGRRGGGWVRHPSMCTPSKQYRFAVGFIECGQAVAMLPTSEAALVDAAREADRLHRDHLESPHRFHDNMLSVRCDRDEQIAFCGHDMPSSLAVAGTFDPTRGATGSFVVIGLPPGGGSFPIHFGIIDAGMRHHSVCCVGAPRLAYSIGIASIKWTLLGDGSTPAATSTGPTNSLLPRRPRRTLQVGDVIVIRVTNARVNILINGSPVAGFSADIIGPGFDYNDPAALAEAERQVDGKDGGGAARRLTLDTDRRYRFAVSLPEAMQCVALGQEPPQDAATFYDRRVNEIRGGEMRFHGDLGSIRIDSRAHIAVCVRAIPATVHLQSFFTADYVKTLPPNPEGRRRVMVSFAVVSLPRNLYADTTGTTDTSGSGTIFGFMRADPDGHTNQTIGSRGMARSFGICTSGQVLLGGKTMESTALVMSEGDIVTVGVEWVDEVPPVPDTPDLGANLLPDSGAVDSVPAAAVLDGEAGASVEAPVTESGPTMPTPLPPPAVAAAEAEMPPGPVPAPVGGDLALPAGNAGAVTDVAAPAPDAGETTDGSPPTGPSTPLKQTAAAPTLAAGARPEDADGTTTAAASATTPLTAVVATGAAPEGRRGRLLPFFQLNGQQLRSDVVDALEVPDEFRFAVSMGRVGQAVSFKGEQVKDVTQFVRKALAAARNRPLRWVEALRSIRVAPSGRGACCVRSYPATLHCEPAVAYTTGVITEVRIVTMPPGSALAVGILAIDTPVRVRSAHVFGDPQLCCGVGLWSDGRLVGNGVGHDGETCVQVLPDAAVYDEDHSSTRQDTPPANDQNSGDSAAGDAATRVGRGAQLRNPSQAPVAEEAHTPERTTGGEGAEARPVTPLNVAGGMSTSVATAKAPVRSIFGSGDVICITVLPDSTVEFSVNGKPVARTAAPPFASPTQHDSIADGPLVHLSASMPTHGQSLVLGSADPTPHDERFFSDVVPMAPPVTMAPDGSPVCCQSVVSGEHFASESVAAGDVRRRFEDCWRGAVCSACGAAATSLIDGQDGSTTGLSAGSLFTVPPLAPSASVDDALGAAAARFAVLSTAGGHLTVGVGPVGRSSVRRSLGASRRSIAFRSDGAIIQGGVELLRATRGFGAGNVVSVALGNDGRAVLFAIDGCPVEYSNGAGPPRLRIQPPPEEKGDTAVGESNAAPTVAAAVGFCAKKQAVVLLPPGLSRPAPAPTGATAGVDEATSPAASAAPLAGLRESLPNPAIAFLDKHLPQDCVGRLLLFPGK